MKRKLSDNQIRMIAIIVLVLLPFLLVYVGKFFGVVAFARLFGLLILFFLFPIALLFFVLNPRYKNDFKLQITGHRVTWPFRLLGLFFGLMGLIYLTFPLLKDCTYLLKNPLPTKQGLISYSKTTAYDLFVRAQKIKFEGNEKEQYRIVYGTRWLKKGEIINIKYLPKTKYILEVTDAD